MKKLSVTALCLVLLMSGCSRPAVSEESPQSAQTSESGESRETASAEIAVTEPSPAVASSSADKPDLPDQADEPTEETAPETEEASDALPESCDYIIPTVIDERARVVPDENSILDVNAVKEAQGYDLDYDYESDELYIRHKEHIESRYTGEKLEEFRSRNYFHPMSIYFRYIGSEQADWLGFASYNIGAQFDSFHQVLYIKGGEIVRKGEVIAAGYIGDFGDKELYAPLPEGGFGIFDIEKCEWRFITTDSSGAPLSRLWFGVFQYSDDHCVFGTENIWIYDRRTEEVVLTDMKVERRLDDRWGIIGNKFCYASQDGTDYTYDLETGELDAETPISSEALLFSENDEYHISSAFENDQYSPHTIDARALVITRKADGAVKAFDLRGLFEPDETRWELYTGDCLSEGDWLILSVYGGIYGRKEYNIALNFETGEAAYFDEGEHGITTGSLKRAQSSPYCWYGGYGDDAGLARLVLPY